ncbi:hypothetical protein [Acanthopleuribacter pedis]|uniref:Uncharacterized protein n=1 Tax=Acanthopleuribacter pedis TaxID=442870 RepID=A0A8J7QFQ2_9BACT|nr:hypothetical protein [Acanthopleuribacter pedis]MBO1323254.1 hypothetical protein [Acanthopleuribacter pedis]
MFRRLSVFWAVWLGLSFGGLFAQDAHNETVWHAWVSARGLAGDGDGRSWTRGDFGKLLVDEGQNGAFAEARFGVERQWHQAFGVSAWGLLRSEANDFGDDWALGEAFARGAFPISNAWRLRYKAGHFFPPSSAAHIDPMWSTPYTLTFSTIDSWIAEEVRHTGLELGFDKEWGNQNSWLLTGSWLRGNDTQGTLLAWRGASHGHRLSGYGEFLPLPAIPSLQPGNLFSLQTDRGTQAYGRELDGNWGWSARTALELGGRFLLQALLSDNRADRELHNGQYAWETRYQHLSLSWDLDPDRNWTLLAEWLDGASGMGERTGAHVQIDFQLWYGLLSLRSPDRHWRFSLRYDDVHIIDRDRLDTAFNPDASDERGDSLTAAIFWEPQRHWRLGLEWLDGDFTHATLDQTPLNLHTGLISVEARYRF